SSGPRRRSPLARRARPPEGPGGTCDTVADAWRLLPGPVRSLRSPGWPSWFATRPRAFSPSTHTPTIPRCPVAGRSAAGPPRGAGVHRVVGTSGDRGSSDPTTDPAELVSRRTAEVAAAAATVGVAGHHLLGHPDGELENGTELRRELVSLVRRLRPEAVVCPDP